MSLSDSTLMQGVKSKGRRAIGATKSNWSDSQKLEAVMSWLMLGNVRLVSSVLKIPEFTLRSWMKTQWWQDTVNELKVQSDLQLGTRLKKLVDRSLDVLEDRLENGDWIYDQKVGELRRKPVAMKDAHKVAIDMIEKQELVQERQSRRPTGVEVEDKLAKLAQMFTDIATKKLEEIQRPVIEVTDVIIQGESEYALHEERETGLQDGVPEVPQSSGADQESFGTDHGPQTI